ncbi:MAG: hypothetical protein WKF84_02985 [Pyrinomonadaceae bacterium]
MPSIVLAAGFTLAGNAKIINIAATNLPYPAYVMFSMTLWQTFRGGIERAVVRGGRR